jgi:hypothetical protein
MTTVSPVGRVAPDRTSRRALRAAAQGAGWDRLGSSERPNEHAGGHGRSTSRAIGQAGYGGDGPRHRPSTTPHEKEKSPPRRAARSLAPHRSRDIQVGLRSSRRRGISGASGNVPAPLEVPMAMVNADGWSQTWCGAASDAMRIGVPSRCDGGPTHSIAIGSAARGPRAASRRRC